MDTYYAESSHDFLGGLDASDDNHVDKVGGYADDDDHAESLQDTDQKEHPAKRHGTVAGDGHFDGLEGCLTSGGEWMEVLLCQR